MTVLVLVSFALVGGVCGAIMGAGGDRRLLGAVIGALAGWFALPALIGYRVGRAHGQRGAMPRS